jgi:hypothetical protein
MISFKRPVLVLSLCEDESSCVGGKKVIHSSVGSGYIHIIHEANPKGFGSKAGEHNRNTCQESYNEGGVLAPKE